MDETRRATNPLWNDNKLKLGVFGGNVGNGGAMTMAEGRLETSWPNARAIATTADQAGFEALVKFHFIAGWSGFPVVGTPEQIVDKLLMLSKAGLDGTVLSWVNYLEELPQWIDECCP